MSKFYKISEEELVRLLARSMELACLYNDGVDNWGYYGEGFEQNRTEWAVKLGLPLFKIREDGVKDYYEYDFINLEGRKKIYSVILEGRAKENFTDGRKSEFKNGFYNEDSDYYCENQVYVAANGNVISNCDLSFETVDKNSFGNVNNETLRSIIDKFTKADDDIQAVVLQ